MAIAPTISLRPAAREDATVVVRLIRELAGYERLGAVPMEERQVYRLTGEPLVALAGEPKGPGGSA